MSTRNAVVVLIQYAVSLRVPLVAGLFLLLFPWFAFTKGRSLFRGLFDQTPLSLLAVTLSAYALAGTVAKIMRLVLLDGSFGIRSTPLSLPWLMNLLRDTRSHPQGMWLWGLAGLCIPTVAMSIYLSRKQGRSTLALASTAVLGLGIGSVVTWFLLAYGSTWAAGCMSHSESHSILKWLVGVMAGTGDGSVYADHFSALCAFVATLILWVILGVYGAVQLGRQKTVPALASLLLVAMILTWTLGAAGFYLDRQHVPLLLLITVFGVVNSVIPWGDHTYNLIEPDRPETAAPAPTQVLKAGHSSTAIVVAAQGGGIQAAAWTAQVLEGLRDLCGKEKFDPSLRMLSGVSGGSVGSVYYTDWVLHGDATRRPTESASESSLDEVAWGLAWPDALRLAAPFFFGWLLDRGKALEIAWSRNVTRDFGKGERLRRGLSAWLPPTAMGNIPALILNSTIVESGFRLLLSTTELAPSPSPNARISAHSLHNILGHQYDVAARTAARLSATFPWVTPTAKANKGQCMPHMVDGGYYDDYGMATLVEWLEQALSGSGHAVNQVLVLEIHCSPVTKEAKKSTKSSRGWLFQLTAPLQAVLDVRTSGQIAHNDIELQLLQDRWRGNVNIQRFIFEFDGQNAPLSWHLTNEEKVAIQAAWSTKEMQANAQAVCALVSGAQNMPVTATPQS